MTDSISEIVRELNGYADKLHFDDVVLVRLLVKAADALKRCSAGTAEAVRTERERCAAVCDEWVKQFGKGSIEYVPATEYATDAVCDIADLIRNGHQQSPQETGNG